jgi:type IV pilus assembly protein PilC
MPNYEYIAKDATGNTFNGVYSDVDNVKELREELKKMGYKLVKSHKIRSAGNAKGGKINPSEIVTFAYEFSGMYSAGLSITRCLETFGVQTETPALKEIIMDVKQQIEQGMTLRDAFEKYKDVFSEFFLGMVEAGETGGKLGETLQMAAVYLEKRAEIRRQVKSAFAYPIIVCIMCLLIVTGLIIFVIPVFQKLYNQLNVPLPAPTQALIFASTVVRGYWWIVTPAVIGIIMTFKYIWRKPFFKSWLDSYKLNMPVFGKLNRMVVASGFVRTFAMMAKAGVPVVEAIGLAKQVADNTEMDKVAKVMQEQIMSGSSIAVPMSKYTIFPPMIIQMAAAGEEAGILPEMLTKGVDFLDTQIDVHIKSLLIKIEPVLSVIMGSVVGSILMGVYLPMFDYMGHIK